MRLGMKWLCSIAEGVLSDDDFQLLLADNPAHHAPQWHQFGVLGHTNAVIVEARRLSEHSGIDIVDLAVLHDAGKIQQFPRAFKLFRLGEDPARAFIGHEAKSAVLAEALGVDDLSCLVIKHHDLAYLPAKAQTIVNLLKSSHRSIRKWFLLCAADGVGKGWTENQKAQRPEIPKKFLEVACFAGIPSDDPVLELASRAVTEWDPVIPPSFWG